MRPPTHRRGRSLAVAAGGALLGVLAGAATLPAQAVERELDDVARDFARAWQAGRVDLLAARLGDGGIRLHLPDGSHPALSVRLARAALEDLHGGVGVGPVTVRQVRHLGGDPARGFVEMTWSPHPSGMNEPMAFTVFTGLERGDASWLVVELRVLPREGGGPPGTRDDSTDERWP